MTARHRTSTQSQSTIFPNPLRPLREFLPNPEQFTVIAHEVPGDHWVELVPNATNPSTSQEAAP